jgi:hypothetical protein
VVPLSRWEFVTPLFHRRTTTMLYLGIDQHARQLRDVPDEVATLKMDQIEVKSYVGGQVKSFERRAA